MSNETTTGLVIKKDVKTELTPERRAELGAEIAAHTIAYDEYEEQKKAATRDITAKMKQERADWTRKAKALRSGVLEEQVECIEEQDFSRNEVSYRRIDNGKICGMRAMTGNERQLSIAGVEDKAPPVVSVDSSKNKRRLKAVPDIENPIPTPEDHH
jgi:hypothetical protein